MAASSGDTPPFHEAGLDTDDEVSIWAQIAPTELDMELLEAEYDLLHSEEQGHQRFQNSHEMRLPMSGESRPQDVILPISALQELRPPHHMDNIDAETVIESPVGVTSDVAADPVSSDEDQLLRAGPTLNAGVNRMLAAAAGPLRAPQSSGPQVNAGQSTGEIKRRRLTKKTTVPPIGPAPLNFIVARKSIIMAKLKKHTGFDRMRDYYEARRTEMLKKDAPEDAALQRRETIRKEWTAMTEEDKHSWVHRELAQQYHCLSVVGSQDYWNSQQQDAEGEEERTMITIRHEIDEYGKSEHKCICAGCLGTWNGSWLQRDTEWNALLQRNLDMDLFIKVAQEIPSFKSLCKDMEAFIKRRITKLGFEKYSIQVEVSLNARARGRIHIHAFWHSDSKPIFNGTPMGWMFRGAVPLLKMNIGKGRNKESHRNRGHYYCQSSKEGRLFCTTNYVMNKHFVVEPKWIMGLWQLRKLSHSSAKSEILQARGRVGVLLKEITTVETMEEALQIELEKKRVDESLKAHMKPFWDIPLVKTWAEQYVKGGPNVLYGVKARFKFLVLNGPSCYGKTQYAKSIYGAAATLLVPCQNVQAPCLKEYRRGFHKCIVFDECNSLTVVQNKMLFQSNNDGVLLGQSQCNEFAYWKYLYCTPLIVCCNNWMAGIEEGSSEAQWLQTNAMVLEVTTPLWRT